MAKQKLKATKPEVSVKEVLAQRGPKYGPFIDQASVSQSLKHVMFATPNWRNLAADQREALEMVAMKISRVLVGDHEHIDNFVDVAGYATLVANRLQKDADSVF